MNRQPNGLPVDLALPPCRLSCLPDRPQREVTLQSALLFASYRSGSNKLEVFELGVSPRRYLQNAVWAASGLEPSCTLLPDEPAIA